MSDFGIYPLLDNDVLAEHLERLAQEPRDLHLRDAERRRDLGLREPLEEAQVQHPLLLGSQVFQRLGKRGAIVDEGHELVVFADVLEDAERVATVDVAVALQRDEVVRLTRLKSGEHVLGSHIEIRRDLDDRGRSL